jgi:hypothetical protein
MDVKLRTAQSDPIGTRSQSELPGLPTLSSLFLAEAAVAYSPQ